VSEWRKVEMDDRHPGCKDGAEVIPPVSSSVDVGLLFEVWVRGSLFLVRMTKATEASRAEGRG
tara:strand:+ start:226 stop:414 length:189 start_codon:yes stop_codon:yes gene_type:complete